MPLRYRAVCDCGWAADWKKTHFVAVGDGNLHGHEDGCDEEYEIESAWASRLPPDEEESEDTPHDPEAEFRRRRQKRRERQRRGDRHAEERRLGYR